jgi:hypothetical protein
MKEEFADLSSTTDWMKLRIEPLLQHVKCLDGILKSPKFARETARLRKGVAMFHADLVYLRTNTKALKAILVEERRKLDRKKGEGNRTGEPQEERTPPT